MATPLGTIRAALKADLANANVWDVFDYVPEKPQALSVVIEPDDPYLEPTRENTAALGAKANFKVVLLTPYRDNQGNLALLEDFITQAFNKLCASTIEMNIGNISQPKVVNMGGSDLLMADFPISVIVEWS